MLVGRLAFTGCVQLEDPIVFGWLWTTSVILVREWFSNKPERHVWRSVIVLDYWPPKTVHGDGQYMDNLACMRAQPYS